MLGYLIATIIFAAALVFTVAIVLMLALGSVFSLLTHSDFSKMLISQTSLLEVKSVPSLHSEANTFSSW